MKIDPLIFSPIANRLVYLWSMTLRYRQHNLDNKLTTRKEHGPTVFAIWHDELFPLGYLHRKEGLVAIVSQSKDGELIARLLDYFGFNLARGSSSRGGVRALINAYRLMHKEQVDAVFTVDGPRGPRHEVKEGIVYLAIKAGAPIIPARVAMSRKKVFHRAWDKFQLPMPFSRIDVHYGEPIFPGTDLEETNIKRQQSMLQKAMDTLL